MSLPTTIELAVAIRRRELSSVEALALQDARIERLDPRLHAVVSRDPDGALAQARAADAALARGDVRGPLHGVPFLLKDCHDAAGSRSTAGSPLFERHVAPRDSPVVARLRGAGAVLAGRTNVAELLADFQCENPLFGRTSNPWDTRRTPGGSSGGATAAVACGLTPFDIGTDLAGSIRLPATFCGVYGLKPTEHRVPLAGVFPDPQQAPRALRVLPCIGPIARSLDDLALLLSLIGGPDARDPDVPPVPFDPSLAAPPLRGLRVACVTEVGALPLAASIRATLERLARELTQAGARVEPAWPAGVDVQADLQAAGELIGMMLGTFDGSAPTAQAPGLDRYLRALHRRDASIARWERHFDDWDVLLCPAAMRVAFEHVAAGTPLAVDGRQAPYHAISGHAALFNYSGHPALAMPAGVDADGLPIGVQLVAQRWDDARLLAIARAIEPLTGGVQAPPGV